MKCKTCNGLGRTKATEFVGVDEGLRDVVILCPACGGKGEVEQTNEEWFNGLSTEEKAEWLYRVHYGGIGIGLTKEEIRKWLKEVHKE